MAESAYRAWPGSVRGGTVDSRKPFARDVVDAWLGMMGPNTPMIKYVATGTSRDFDVNLEGMAHYGLIPDWLQDVKNVGVSEQEMSSLFQGVEDYIEMWEKIEAKKASAVTQPDWL